MSAKRQRCKIPAILLMEAVHLKELDKYTYMGEEVSRRAASGTN